MLRIDQDHIDGGVTICRPFGELDAFTVKEFRQALNGLASDRRLVIDMSEVSFVDSAGLGALIGGIRHARELGGDVAVVCSRTALARALRTTGFDRIVTVARTASEAAASFDEDRPNEAGSGRE
jgi:anti-sigma B factor antagonist